MWRDGSKLVNGSVDEPGLRASKTFRIRYCPSLWSLINRTFSAKFSQLEYFVYRYDEEENVQDFPDPRNLFGLYWVPINTYIYISNFFSHDLLASLSGFISFVHCCFWIFLDLLFYLLFLPWAKKMFLFWPVFVVLPIWRFECQILSDMNDAYS